MLCCVLGTSITLAALHTPQHGSQHCSHVSRRALAGAFAAAGLSGVLPTSAATLLLTEDGVTLRSAEIYSVVPDSTKTLSPTVKPLTAGAIVKQLASQQRRAVFLGEHHNSAADHLLQSAVIRELHKTRGSLPMAVGLEAVQRRFQPALDSFVAGRIGEEELEDATEWRKRWFWPFAAYAPVFRACRELGIPLLALNVDSEDLSRVEVGGLPALPPETLRSYVTDPEGFSAFAATTAFKEYVAYIVKPSYQMHQRMGILRTTITGQMLDEDMSFRNFFSGRILWDESMGSSSAAWCRNHPEGLLVGLVGSDHVKFGCGVPARCARQLPGGLASVASVMLNPRPSDTVSHPSTRLLMTSDDR